MSRKVASTLVARRILEIGEGENRRFTNIQLQKLTFLAHGWSFPLLDKPLVDEDVEAWQYGPVFRALYKVLRNCGSKHVTDVPKSLKEHYFDVTGQSSLSRKECKLIDFVYDEYAQKSAWELVTLTHEKDTPWYNTEQDEVIERYKIQKYFDKKAGELKQRPAF